MSAITPSKWFFLRGLVRETGHWQDFLHRFASEVPGAEAIGLDLPGNGARFAESSPLTIDETVDKVRADFLSRQGDRNFLCAISLGAMVGFAWLERYPEDFRGAVFMNTSLRGLSPFHERLRPGIYGEVLKALFTKDHVRKEELILGMTSSTRVGDASLAQAWAEIHGVRPVSTSNFFRQLLAAARFRPPRTAPPVPVLLLNGAGDRLCAPTASERIALHWNLPLRTHLTAGHDLTLDAPNWVVEEIRNFAESRLR
jgi:pimeloyl-ACP methyl ester carboxylesterase